MSGFSLFKRLRSVGNNSQQTKRNAIKTTGCKDRDLSLRLLVKQSDRVKDGSSNVKKYFDKGSPSITQEIDYQLDVSFKIIVSEYTDEI